MAKLAETVVTPRGNYTNYTGEETNIPTLEEYTRAKASERSIEAIYNMLNQYVPIVPLIPNQGLLSRLAGKFGMSDAERIQRFGKCENPATCINTVTSMYGPSSIISGNKTFAENPELYGFTVIPDPRAGDIMQFYSNGIPHHATMITGFNRKGQPALSYSNGNIGEYSTDGDGNLVRNIKWDNDNWNPNWREENDPNSLSSIGDKVRVYRFIGTDKDKKDWRKEYIEKYFRYRQGSKIRFYQNGGKEYYITSLDSFIKSNPTIKGINTKDFRDFFIELVLLESSYNPKASNRGRYSGWYALQNGANLSEQDQHKAAYEHLRKIFNENITKEDLKVAQSKGISPAQLLAKYWNQGNRVTNYIHRGIDYSDRLGTRVSEYGNDIQSNLDYISYVPDAITDDYIVVTSPNSLADAAKRARNDYIDYANRDKWILDLNKSINPSFNPTSLQLNDTIWLYTTNLPAL